MNEHLEALRHSRAAIADTRRVDQPSAPCLRCNVPLPVRRMGCKAGHCSNCRHPYPHGDCSD